MKKPKIPAFFFANNSRGEKSSAMTTLIDAPHKITLSENASTFRFAPVATGNRPTESNCTIQVTSYVPVGESITLKGNRTSIVITASTTPNNNQFLTTATPPTNRRQLQEYKNNVAESIADTLEQYSTMRNNYSITLSNNTVTITANTSDSDYNFTTSTTSTTSIVMVNQLAVEEFLNQEKIGYTAFCNIYTSDRVYDSVIPKDKSIFVGSMIFDATTTDAFVSANSVKDYLEHILPIKSFVPFDGFYRMEQGLTSSGTVIQKDNLKFIMRPYFLEYGDRYSYVENHAKKNFVKGVSEVRWMQLGAFDKLLPYNIEQFVFDSSSFKSFGWLSSVPAPKKITYTSHEYLQCIFKLSQDQINCNLQLNCRFTDGTSVIIEKSSIGCQNVGGNVSFDVSPLAMDIASIEDINGKLIDRYSVRLKWLQGGSNEAFSYSQTYIMDRTCYRSKNNVIFLNEFGAWDSLEFKGMPLESLNRETDTITRHTPDNANTEQSISAEVSLNISTNTTTIHSMESGVLSYDLVKWYKKMGESAAVYIWDNKYNQYRSILISSFNYNLDSTNVASSFSITYTYTTQNNTISR